MLIAMSDLKKLELLQAYRKYWNRGVALEFTDEEVAAVPKEMYMAAKKDIIKDIVSKKDVREICSEEDGKLRCAAFYPFAAVAGTHSTFYIVNGTNIYI